MKKITLIRLATFLVLLFSTTVGYAQCPYNYVSNPTAKTITFQFEAGNAAKDQDIACDFVRKHGGTGVGPCSGGSITVDGIIYTYTGNDGGGTGPITLTYTAGVTVTTAPTAFEIAEGIGCGQTSENECFTIYFQDTKNGENCSSSNSDFSFTINDKDGCGPYTLVTSGNSALTFPTSITTGTYSTGTIKAGIYILVFEDLLGNEQSIIYNHITQVGTCLRQSNLDIVKTITSGDPYTSVGNTVNYQYAVTSDAPITAPFVVDDHIVGNITAHTGDTNNDGILQVGETWIFTGTYTIVTGDITNGSVTNIAYARGLDGYGLPIFSEVDEATATLCNLSATVMPTNATCFGGNGSIAISSVSGGSGTYQYSINGGTTWTAGLSNLNLPAGTYQVQIRDANATSCVIDLDGTTGTVITQPAVLSATVTPTNATCFDCSKAFSVPFNRRNPGRSVNEYTSRKG